jgi:hypothetical protein
MWERISLPLPSDQVQGFAVSPRDPATLFACTATLPPPVPDDPFASAQAATPQPFGLWRSTDAGAHWAQFAPLDARGMSCAFSIAPDDPRRITFQVSQIAPGEHLCGQESFYLSTDGGASWRSLPHHSIAPAGVSDGWCELHVSAHHLFLLYVFPQTSATGTPQISLLERSDDDGTTWTRADGGMGEHALYFMPQIGPGETLAVTVIHLSGMPATPSPNAPLGTELWTSPDAGRTWTRAAALPEQPDTFLWSAPPQSGRRWPNAAHPFYVLQTEQIPSELYRESVLASGDAQHWALVPPLPVPGTDSEHWGILQALAALPDGRLAVWGADPQAGVPAEGHGADPMRAFWLWLWDPVQAQWQQVATPLDVAAHEGCNFCWQVQAVSTQDGAQCLYVEDLFEAQYYSLQDVGMWRMCMPRG